MKELTLSTMLAVFEEMFGPALFWALVVLAILILGAFVYMLIRDRGLKPVPLLRAEIIGPIGGIASILFVQMITNSGFSDIGGATDVILVFLIFLAGTLGTVMLAYLAQGVGRMRR